MLFRSEQEVVTRAEVETAMAEVAAAARAAGRTVSKETIPW